jgi:hypothetical protein
MICPESHKSSPTTHRSDVFEQAPKQVNQFQKLLLRNKQSEVPDLQWFCCIRHKYNVGDLTCSANECLFAAYPCPYHTYKTFEKSVKIPRELSRLTKVVRPIRIENLQNYQGHNRGFKTRESWLEVLMWLVLIWLAIQSYWLHFQVKTFEPFLPILL